MAVIFIFLAVIVVTAVLFGGWVIMMTFRGIGKLLGVASSSGAFGSSDRCCANPGCRSINPKHANYCRRCGASLTNPIAMSRTPQPQAKFNPPNGNGRQMARV